MNKHTTVVIAILAQCRWVIGQG